MEQLTIQNQPLKVNRRFDRLKYEFVEEMYEEYIFINGKNITKLTKYPFNCLVSLNRLLFED